MNRTTQGVRMIYDSHLFKMRFDKTRVVPMFVSYAINGFSGLKNEIVQRSSGAIMSGLNTKIFRPDIMGSF